MDAGVEGEDAGAEGGDAEVEGGDADAPLCEGSDRPPPCPPAPRPAFEARSIVAAEVPSVFSLAGSEAGEGEIVAASVDFGDGSALVVVEDVAAEIEHTFAAAGEVLVTVSMTNSAGARGVLEAPLRVEEPARDILIVYNAALPQSEALALAYASPRTGRAVAVDDGLLLGLELPEGPAVDRDTYRALIRAPILERLDAMGLRRQVRTILLIKGVPHQIRGEREFETSSTFSSVDSELCLLTSDGDYPLEGWLWNGPRYQDFSGGGLYLAEDRGFAHQRFTASSRQGRLFNIDYLVGRLDGYTFEDARAILDRALRADASAEGWVILDSSPERRGLDTMVDPVFPEVEGDAQESAEEVLLRSGIKVFADAGPERLFAANPAVVFPEGAAERVIAYAGWGVNHVSGAWPSGPRYILDDLGLGWLPGAAFISYESFNGTALDGAALEADVGLRRGQGQIADFLRAGGTVAIGNAWEPFSVGVGDERHIFKRYLVDGDPWIEAAYKGLRMLSWQQIVIGDPLCRARRP